MLGRGRVAVHSIALGTMEATRWTRIPNESFPTWRDATSGLRFIEVTVDDAVLGLTDIRRHQLKKALRVSDLSATPFAESNFSRTRRVGPQRALVAETPVLLSSLTEFRFDDHPGRPTLDGSYDEVAFLSWAEAERVLSGWQLGAVSEDLWEAAIGHFMNEPFWLPSPQSAPDAELARHCEIRLGAPVEHPRTHTGLVGAAIGEFAVSPDGPVVKAGAGMNWPWQTQWEVALMATSFRSSDSEFAAVRPCATRVPRDES